MKKKLLVTTIVMAMAISTLIGCGKSDNNDSLQNSMGNEEINSEMLPAEGGSVNEDIGSGEESIEIGNETVEMTFEEYLNMVTTYYSDRELLDTIPNNSAVDPSGSGLTIFIKDENDAEFTFSRVYGLYHEPIEGEVPGTTAIGLDMLEPNIDFSQYGIDSPVDMIGLVGFGSDIPTNEDGSYNLVPMHDYVIPSLVPFSSYCLLYDFVPEAVHNNLYFEYDSALNSSVLKTDDGNVLAYFGEYSTVEVDDFYYATFTTKLAEGDFVVYMPMRDCTDSLSGDIYPNKTMTGKEYVFVTHH